MYRYLELLAPRTTEKLHLRKDEEAKAVRGYCLAVRSAISDDGRPPLAASGIKLHDRLEAVQSSIERVGKKENSQKS